MRLAFIATALGLALAGCAAPSIKPTDLTGGAKRVSFVQNGRFPGKYSIGAVDGKTSWSNYSILGARLNEDNKVDSAPTTLSVTGKAGPDLAAGAGLEIISAIGKSIADSSMKDDPKFYDRLLLQMVGKREIGTETGRVVMPIAARALGVPYSSTALILLPSVEKIEDESGRYLLGDAGSDLVVAFTLSEMMLSEKPSARALKSIVTFGMYDKVVMPYFLGDLAVYRRQPTGHMQRVWKTRCGNSFQDAPSEEWTNLRESPELGGSLIDQTVPRVAVGCEAALRQQLASAE
jgi:hypothetical protein